MRKALTTRQSFWLGHIKAAQYEGIALAQYANHNGLNVKVPDKGAYNEFNP